jgi:hypothetical protein
MDFEWDVHMKKPIIEYQEEPRQKGWRFDPSAKPLAAEAQRRAGIPAPGAAGTLYERTEQDGRIVVKPLRGGKRAGAGRKATGHVRLNLLVPPETREQLKKLADRDHVTLSEAFRRSLAAQ